MFFFVQDCKNIYTEYTEKLQANFSSKKKKKKKNNFRLIRKV